MAKAKPKKMLSGMEIELRRWCVERAVQWPQVQIGSPYGGGMHMTGTGISYQDADVIGRAQKIFDWVSK